MRRRGRPLDPTVRGGGGGAGGSLGNQSFAQATNDVKKDLTIQVPENLLDMPNGARVVDWMAELLRQVDNRNVIVRTA